VAEQKPNPLLRLLNQALFRIAFGGFIVVQCVLFALLLWAVSEIVPEPNYFLLGILLVLVFAGPFLIGAFSYLVFRRITREEYLRAEADRWLAERHDANPSRIERLKRLRRWAVWIPALSVLLFCLFLDQTWPPLTHLLHPNYGRLGAYRVPLSLDWTVIFSEPDPGGRLDRSYVYANRWRGMLRSGIDEFVGRKPSMTSSSLSCVSSRSDEFNASSSSADHGRLVATRTYSTGNVPLTCEEFVSQDPGTAGESRVISCVTPKHDFYCTLYRGGEEEDSELYRMVQRIKKTK
jgi:hypothetical protein